MEIFICKENLDSSMNAFVMNVRYFVRIVSEFLHRFCFHV